MNGLWERKDTCDVAALVRTLLRRMSHPGLEGAHWSNPPSRQEWQGVEQMSRKKPPMPGKDNRCCSDVPEQGNHAKGVRSGWSFSVSQNINCDDTFEASDLVPPSLVLPSRSKVSWKETTDDDTKAAKEDWNDNFDDEDMLDYE